MVEIRVGPHGASRAARLVCVPQPNTRHVHIRIDGLPSVSLATWVVFSSLDYPSLSLASPSSSSPLLCTTLHVIAHCFVFSCFVNMRVCVCECVIWSGSALGVWCAPRCCVSRSVGRLAVEADWAAGRAQAHARIADTHYVPGRTAEEPRAEPDSHESLDSGVTRSGVTPGASGDQRCAATPAAIPSVPGPVQSRAEQTREQSPLGNKRTLRNSRGL